MARRYMKILFVILVPLFITACGSDDSETFVPKRAKPKVVVADPVISEGNLIESRQAGFEKPKRNPFLSYIMVRKGKEKVQRIRGPLECCGLNLFRVMAVVLSGDSSYALVHAPDGKRYIVRRGDLMGLVGGRVVKIDSDGLKVREYTRDDEGRALSFKDRELKILTKEEGGISAR
ncbi:MAG: pilus assembly protein PilP [Thermodesulfobacteriota bacterium]